MKEQGSSTYSVRSPEWILDRLVGLENIISRECVLAVLHACNKVNGRACELTHEVMLWVVVAMGLLTHLPIRQVFRHAGRWHGVGSTPQRSSLCEGRKRLGVEPLKQLYSSVVRPLANPETPGAFYKGMRLVGIDGVVMDVPNSEANESFGRSAGSRGEAPFPQVRKVSLVELGTHLEFKFVYGGWSDGEKTLVKELWDFIPDDALLMQDCGFFSYESWKALHNKHFLLVRVNSTLVLEPTKQLSDGSYLSKLYANSWDRQKDRKGTVVRVIKYTHDDPNRTGCAETHRLLTNLLDEKAFPAEELICLYHERWEQESVFDEQKTHQDPVRAEKATHLRSQTPDGVAQELYALSLGHFVVRAMMLDAAQQEGIDVDRLSFTSCFRILQCRLPECTNANRVTLNEWYQALLSEMREEKIPPRRDRINPRVIKRKMSRWEKAKPEHRGSSNLTKPFDTAVVMLS